MTSRTVTSARSAELEASGTKNDLIVRVIDRKTLANRLSDFSNGISYRHFPDIRKQVEVLYANLPAQALEPRSLVRAALTFTSHRADAARHHVLDELVFSLVMKHAGKAVSAGQLVADHHAMLPGARQLEEEQVRSSAERLSTNGWVESNASGMKATDRGIERNVALSLELGEARHGLSADIADAVEKVIDSELDQSMRGRLERNITDALAFIFRLMGLEVSSQLLGRSDTRTEQIGSHEEVIRLIGRDLPAGLRAIAIAATADLLSRPNEEQAQCLAAYACGYIGASLSKLIRRFGSYRSQE